jgi:hypothetical protein
MQALFRTADLTTTDWLLAAAAGAAVVPVVSVEKAWRRRPTVQRRTTGAVSQHSLQEGPHR